MSTNKNCKGNNGKNRRQGSNSNNRRSAKQWQRGEATNPFSHWNKYPTLTKDAADFTFNIQAGQLPPLEGVGTPFPGVYVATYLPTIGRSISSDSPFMAQIRSVWLDMHRKYRGISNKYQCADLGVFVFCAINAFAELARAEKIYGFYRDLNMYNRNVPRVLLDAMGVEWTDNMRKLADFRASLDRLNARASELCLPKGFSAYEDAVLLATATIKDSDGPRASILTFNAGGFYVFSGTAYQSGSAAIFHQRSNTGARNTQTFDDIIDDLTSQIEVLFNDEDCYTMGSDILAAYGENGVEKRNGVPEEYLSPIEKDDARLIQVHNATFLQSYQDGAVFSVANVIPMAAVSEDFIPPTAPVLDIIQADNVLYHDLHIVNTGAMAYMDAEGVYSAPFTLGLIPSLSATGYFVPCQSQQNPKFLPFRINDRLLDTWSDDVSVEEKMEMTRFTVPILAESYTGSSKAGDVKGLVAETIIKPMDYGTNVLLGISTFSRNPATGAGIMRSFSNGVINPTTTILAASPITNWLYFDWAPPIYVQDNDLEAYGNSGLKRYINDSTAIIGDVDHYTVIKDNSLILHYLHEAAVMSAYRCELTSSAKTEMI